MSALLEDNEAYQVITVMRLDWDIYRGETITKELNVRRQSTLIMFNGGKEINRVIAQTSASAIEEMIKDCLLYTSDAADE